MADYDYTVTGYRREKFIDGILSETDAITICASSQSAPASVIGYIHLVRTNQDTFLPEPLYADSQEVAEYLLGLALRRLLSEHTQIKLTVKFWTDNKWAWFICQKLGLQFAKDLSILCSKEELKVGGNNRIVFRSTNYYHY